MRTSDDSNVVAPYFTETGRSRLRTLNRLFDGVEPASGEDVEATEIDGEPSAGVDMCISRRGSR